MTTLGDIPVRLLEEFAIPLGGGALDVRFESDTPRGVEVTGRDTFGGRYLATLELSAYLDVKIDKLAVVHANDPAAFMLAYARERLEPWRAKLVRAGSKAIDVWQDELG